MRRFWGLLFLLPAGCDSDDPVETPPPVEACAPSEAGWAELASQIETYCGNCHGETPQFGATLPLHSHAAITTGTFQDRSAAEWMADRVSDGTMPPANQPRLPPQTAQALVAWATCQSVDDVPLPNPGGFDATADIFEAPPEPPADTPFFELLADNFVVPSAVDHYECFNFTAPTDTPRLMRRIDAVVDDARVLHHLVLMRGHATPGACQNLENDVYAWAPGMGPLEFPNGGLEMGAGEPFHVQIHYYNRPGHMTQDSSGVRIYHGPADGDRIGMVTLGTRQFAVPAQSRQRVEGFCVLPEPTTVLASWPHMHQIGARFEATVLKADGEEIDLVTLDGWDFESQFVYHTPIELAAGDIIRTRCDFENMSAAVVPFGPGTEDEMCFNFMYHSPPLSVSSCDVSEDGGGGASYAPGPCIDEDAWGQPAETAGPFAEGAAPAPLGGMLPQGAWTWTEGTLYLPSPEQPAGQVDLEESEIEGVGVVLVDADQVIIDLQAEVEVVYSDGEDEYDLSISVAGAPTAEGGQLSLAATCGDDGLTTFGYAVDGDRLVLHVNVEEPPSTAVLIFERR
jgi:hypothetical protein